MRHAPSPDQEVALWLARLDGALTQRDIPAATELFLAESYWRDMVAFTWNVHTAEGREAIGEMLEACLHHVRPVAWQIDGPARNHDGIVEAALTLETACGRARGVVRLKDGLCWTMLTTLAELKGHEELSSAAASPGPLRMTTGPAVCLGTRAEKVTPPNLASRGNPIALSSAPDIVGFRWALA